ncbi:MAG: SH3 domain-containing protein [Novosphingobium sp.]
MPLRPFVAALALCLAVPAAAQDAETPYWASLRVDEVNMRVGPSEEYRISWVYRRAQLPLKVIRLKEGWRLVEDHDGTRGWMMARFLTRDRGAVVIGQGLAEMRAEGSTSATLRWRLEPGVVGRLGNCEEGWCGFAVGKRSGYVRQSRLWGAGDP